MSPEEPLFRARMRVPVYPEEPVLARMGIDLGRREADVAQKLFYREKVCPGLHEVGRKGVTQCMSGEAARAGCVLEARTDRSLDGATGEA